MILMIIDHFSVWKGKQYSGNASQKPTITWQWEVIKGVESSKMPFLEPMSGLFALNVQFTATEVLTPHFGF